MQATGIVFLPLIVIAVTGMSEARKNASDQDTGIRALRVIEQEVYIVLLIVFICVQPTIILRPENSQEAKDALLRSLLVSDAIVRQSRITNTYPREIGGGEAFKNDLSIVGLLWEAPSMYVKTHVLKKAAPIVQAILLMFGIMVLPILLVVGEYSIKTIVSLTLLFFSIHFWSFLFAAADWVDNNLWDALETAGYASGTVPEARYRRRQKI